LKGSQGWGGGKHMAVETWEGGKALSEKILRSILLFFVPISAGRSH